jgi:hypothetical protein
MPDDDNNGSSVDVVAYRDTLVVKAGNRLHEAEGRDCRTLICNPPGATPILCAKAFESHRASRDPPPPLGAPHGRSIERLILYGRYSSAAAANEEREDDLRAEAVEGLIVSLAERGRDPVGKGR